jgi:RimJ/RimL family protein N-acetyltransferase
VFPEYVKSKPQQILLSIRERGELIGYSGLVHINWPDKRAEVSFLLNNQISEASARYNKIFKSTLSVLKRIAFFELKLNRLFTETYSVRTEHLRTLVSSGFMEEGIMRQHVFFDGEFRDSLIHGFLARDLEEIEKND